MAVTSLWHIKGNLKDLIDYVENPEKTVPNEDMQDFFHVIVATHLDRWHLHNHFCFNSVSYLDGKKYNYSKSE